MLPWLKKSASIYNQSLTYELPLAGSVTDFLRLCCIACQQSIYKHKKKNCLFSGALPLVVAGSGTKKVSIVISKSNYIGFWNRNVCFLRTGRSQNPENKSVLFFIKPRLCGMQYPDCENPSIQNTSGRTQYRYLFHNREFHNVNCRFCGAIHDVDWANISVLSQVIRNVN